jgi:hypothetical protein
MEAGDERGGRGRGGGVRGAMAGRRCGWGCVQPVPVQDCVAVHSGDALETKQSRRGRRRPLDVPWMFIIHLSFGRPKEC